MPSGWGSRRRIGFGSLRGGRSFRESVVEELLVLVAVAVDWRFFYCWRMHFVDVELHWNRAFFDAGIDLGVLLARTNPVSSLLGSSQYTFTRRERS